MKRRLWFSLAGWFPDRTALVPRAVDLGALDDGVRAAVIAVEQAVQCVYGGGAHDVAVLENAAHAGGVVEDVEARVAEVAGHAEWDGRSGGEDIVAAADHGVGPVGAEPCGDGGGGMGAGDEEGRDGGRGGRGAALFIRMGGLPLGWAMFSAL